MIFNTTLLQEEWRGEVITLAWKPRAFVLKGFLSDEECEHIKQKVSGLEFRSNPTAALLAAPTQQAAGCTLGILRLVGTSAGSTYNKDKFVVF